MEKYNKNILYEKDEIIEFKMAIDIVLWEILLHTKIFGETKLLLDNNAYQLLKEKWEKINANREVVGNNYFNMYVKDANEITTHQIY